VSVALLILSKQGVSVSTHAGLLITVAATTVCWVTAAFVAPETDRAVLVSFYRKVRPFGPGWERIRLEAGVSTVPDEAAHHNIPRALLGWLAGCTAIWSSLFAVGNFLYGRLPQAWLMTAIFLVSGTVLTRIVQRLWSGPAH
jgi:hypothetical protein